MNLSDMKIGLRLALGFALTIAIQLAMSLSGIHRIDHGADLTEEIVNDRYVKVVLTNEMRSFANRAAQGLRNALLAPDAAASGNFLAGMAEADRSGAASAAKLEKMPEQPEGKKLFGEQHHAFVAYSEKRDRVVKQFQGGDKDGAVQFLFNEVVPLQTAYFARLDAILAHQGQLMAEDGKEAAESAEQAKLMQAGMLLLATLVSIVAGYLITRSVTGPINEAVAVAETVAQGDLTARIEVRRKDEAGRLLGALKDMVGALTRTVSAVRQGTETITTASAEIASGNMDLSRRTEQQAASLEETASSMEELTSTVRQNADNARQANELVVSAAGFADEGGQVVGEVVQTMGAIKDSSARIADIIGVIDGIAFQTNILALNAAVEAARAGEQGRGFAVVASEVRNLAQRSASAAKEIKELINDSVQKVDAGGRLVDQAGASMQRIVASVQQVATIMTDITSASQEQSAGIEQVNTSITEMDNSTQQNAALVEQAAAAARSMQEQAVHLAEVVAVFRLDGAAARPAPALASVAAPRPAAAPRSALVEKPVAAPRRARRASDGAGAASPAATAAQGDSWEEF